MNKTTVVYACLSVFLQPCAFFRNAPFFPLIFALLLSAVGVTGPCTGFHLGLDHPGLVEDGPSCIGCVCEGVISVPIFFSPLWFRQSPQEMGSVFFFWLQVLKICICVELGALVHGKVEQGLKIPFQFLLLQDTVGFLG